jgi:hypothetical protein
MKKAIWLICLVGMGLSAPVAHAQPAESGDFGGLVLGGSIGALVGGVGGGLAAYGLCRATTAAGPWADLACLAGAMLFGYVPGVSLGATVGVNIVGSSQKIEGNVWLALGGAILGEALAYFAFDWALRSLGETPASATDKRCAHPRGALWGHSHLRGDGRCGGVYPHGTLTHRVSCRAKKGS